MRALKLKATINYYANSYIQRVTYNNTFTISYNNKVQNVPQQMRSTSLTTYNQVVITKYTYALQPLKKAILSLKARSKSNNFSVIYKVISTFKVILKAYKYIVKLQIDRQIDR